MGNTLLTQIGNHLPVHVLHCVGDSCKCKQCCAEHFFAYFTHLSKCGFEIQGIHIRQGQTKLNVMYLYCKVLQVFYYCVIIGILSSFLHLTQLCHYLSGMWGGL